MNTIPNIRAWDEGETEPWKQSYRKPAMLKVIKMGAGMESVICESNSILGKGTPLEVHEHIALLDPPLMWGSGLPDKNGTEFFTDDRVSHKDSHGTIIFEAGAFMIDFGDLSQLLYGLHLDYVVTGNIYQNPELIKQ